MPSRCRGRRSEAPSAIKARFLFSASVSAGMAAKTFRTCSIVGPVRVTVCLGHSGVLGRKIEVVGI